MLGDVLVLLRDKVDAFLHAAAASEGADSAEDLVQFLDGEKTDPIEFRLNALTLLLVHVEHEPHLRSADPYLRAAADGRPQRIQPDIRLNLQLLFVARFKSYALGLNQLGRVLRWFQAQPVLDRGNTPALPAGVERLVLELVTLPLHEQNDIWSALRIHYHPSLLFKLRMVVFSDADAVALPQVSTTTVRTLQRTP